MQRVCLRALCPCTLWLQSSLALPVPEWHHHGLITDEAGRRLAKRDNALSIRSLREAGWTPARVWEAVGLPIFQ